MSNLLPCRGSATCRLYSILSLFKMLQYCMFFLGHIINVLSKVLIKQANARKLQEHVNLSFECLIYVCVCVCLRDWVFLCMCLGGMFLIGWIYTVVSFYNCLFLTLFCVVFVFSRGVFVVFNCWKHAFHELKRLFLLFFGHFVFWHCCLIWAVAVMVAEMYILDWFSATVSF